MSKIINKFLCKIKHDWTGYIRPEMSEKYGIDMYGIKCKRGDCRAVKNVLTSSPEKHI